MLNGVKILFMRNDFYFWTQNSTFSKFLFFFHLSFKFF